MQNLALDKPALQSSTSPWSTSADKEIDAQVANNGDIVANRFFHTEEELRPWWQVDLGEPCIVSHVVIYNRLEFQHRLNRFTVLRSVNGHDWFELAKKTDDKTFDELSLQSKERRLTRFLRIRLEGYGCLHFRQCQVFGEPPTAEDQERLLRADAQDTPQRADARERAQTLPPPEGRQGAMQAVGEFMVFIDDNYGPEVKKALGDNSYEGRERALAASFLNPGDRVLEVGTAIGVVTMTAAVIVGPHNVITFEANPAIAADARDNFALNGFSAITSKVGVLANRTQYREGAQAEFHIAKDFWASRLHALGKTDIIETVKVPVMCLEREIEQFQANVVICDIEGGEVDLFMNADLDRIRLIIMETHYWARGETATDTMVRELILKGFSIHLDKSGHGVCVLRRG